MNQKSLPIMFERNFNSFYRNLVHFCIHSYRAILFCESIDHQLYHRMIALFLCFQCSGEDITWLKSWGMFLNYCHLRVPNDYRIISAKLSIIYQIFSHFLTWCTLTKRTNHFEVNYRARTKHIGVWVSLTYFFGFGFKSRRQFFFLDYFFSIVLLYYSML